MNQRTLNFIMALIMLVTCLLSVDADGDQYESNGIEVRQVYCVPPAAMVRIGSGSEQVADKNPTCSVRSFNAKVTTFYNSDAPFHPIALHLHFAASPALLPLLRVVSVLPTCEQVMLHMETRGPPRSPTPLLPNGFRAPPIA